MKMCIHCSKQVDKNTHNCRNKPSAQSLILLTQNSNQFLSQKFTLGYHPEHESDKGRESIIREETKNSFQYVTRTNESNFFESLKEEYRSLYVDLKFLYSIDSFKQEIDIHYCDNPCFICLMKIFFQEQTINGIELLTNAISTHGGRFEYIDYGNTLLILLNIFHKLHLEKKGIDFCNRECLGHKCFGFFLHYNLKCDCGRGITGILQNSLFIFDCTVTNNFSDTTNMHFICDRASNVKLCHNNCKIKKSKYSRILDIFGNVLLVRLKFSSSFNIKMWTKLLILRNSNETWSLFLLITFKGNVLRFDKKNKKIEDITANNTFEDIIKYFTSNQDYPEILAYSNSY